MAGARSLQQFWANRPVRRAFDHRSISLAVCYKETGFLKGPDVQGYYLYQIWTSNQYP